MRSQRESQRVRRPMVEGLESRALLSVAGLSKSAHVAPATSHPKPVTSVIENLPATPQLTVSTIPANGDLNPYGVAFVPQGFAKGGPLKTGDILVSNFNASSNLQGTGSTIVDVTPQGNVSTFFQGAPGLGLTTALGVLQRGIVVAGALPTTDGTPATLGQGSLILLNKFGQQIATFSNQQFLDGPWDLTVVDHGSTASLFVSDVLSGTVTRIDLFVPLKGNSVVVKDTVQIASGFPFRTDPGALVVGPAGLAYSAKNDVLFVASQDNDTIYAIPHATKSKGDHGTGVAFIQDATHLHGPLGLAIAPNGNLLVANSDTTNVDPNQLSEIVEYTPNGKFLAQFSLDPGTQAAPFGLAINATPRGLVSLALVNDVTNQLEVFSFQSHGS
jgi:hypothetical protein